LQSGIFIVVTSLTLHEHDESLHYSGKQDVATVATEGSASAFA
jgi:hypothetical protein